MVKFQLKFYHYYLKTLQPSNRLLKKLFVKTGEMALFQ